MSRDSLIIEVTNCSLDDRGSFLGRSMDLSLATSPIPDLEPIQSSFEWISGTHSLWIVTTQLYLEPRLRMRGALPLLPHSVGLKHRVNVGLYKSHLITLLSKEVVSSGDASDLYWVTGAS
jgi:hypothetical protein